MSCLSMSRIITPNARIRARAMSSCFHPHKRRPTRTCPLRVESGSVGCSTTTTARPHEYFDPTAQNPLTPKWPGQKRGPGGTQQHALSRPMRVACYPMRRRTMTCHSTIFMPWGAESLCMMLYMDITTDFPAHTSCLSLEQSARPLSFSTLSSHSHTLFQSLRVQSPNSRQEKRIHRVP
jgi:hypothetical protein